MSINLLAIVML